MLCPGCNHNLSPLSLKTQVTDVVIDLCQTCGGVWTDQGEINFMKSKDVGRLAHFLPAKPKSFEQTHLFCPKDRQKLEIFRHESVPGDIAIYRCLKCNGFWFPSGSLAKFKRAQETKLNYFKTWKIPLSSIYAVLLPLILIAVIGGGIWATLVGVKQGTDVRTKASEFISEPLTISPQPGEILISFTTQKPSSSKIKYWTTSEDVTEIWVSQTPKTTHTIHLKSLDLEKYYSYQTVLPESGNVTSRVFVFTTGKKD